ncbi:MAG TPA: hypothetical protein VEF04_00215, partial [Blastocatellia bacterium]|nr:hypothetical protein [Blastocatellia bacterium]
MKVLYIGHTYSIKANQDKISALAEHPDLQLLLLTPSEWKGPLYDHKSDVYPESDRVEHRALPALFTGKESLYIFRQGLRKIVKDFQPDILHVEQGTYAAVFGQAILACSHAAPNAKATFFTWWNLPTPIRGVKKVLEHFNLRRSACAIAGNHDAKTLLEGKGFDRPIFVMPQIGVSLSDYAQPADTALREQLRLKKFVVGYIGRIAEEKGIADLVASMAGRRDWSLLTVGSGPI